jgi:hypothetical protein
MSNQSEVKPKTTPAATPAAAPATVNPAVAKPAVPLVAPKKV